MSDETLFDLPAFARRVRVRIAELGIDQLAVARACRIAPSSICRILKGQHAPSVENYLRLCRWLDETTA